MNVYPSDKAPTESPELVEHASASQSRRITRDGKETAVVASNDALASRSPLAPTFGALLAHFARSGTFSDEAVDQPWQERPLGVAFE